MQKQVKQSIGLFMIFLIVGGFMIMSAVVSFINDTRFIATAAETEAVITEIEKSSSDDGNIYIVYIEYVAEDMRYRGSYTSNYEEKDFRTGQTGQIIKLYYDSDNPHDFRTNKNTFNNLELAGFGFLFFLVGALPLIFMLKGHLKKKKLLAEGKKLKAVICDAVSGSTVNEKRAQRLICEYKDEIGGKSYIFKSGDVWIKPYVVAEGRDIFVYVDHNNFSKYYVDIDSFLREVER